MRRRFVASVVAFCCLAPATAQAQQGSFTELVVGFASPVDDTLYDGTIDDSVLVGVRGGSRILRDKPISIAVEGSFVWQPLATKDIPLLDFGFSTRLRLSAGLRVAYRTGQVQLFARFAAGVDYVDLDLSLAGIDIGDDDFGYLLEPGAGVIVNAGSVWLGLQVAVPIAEHDGDVIDNDSRLNYLNYTSKDVDVLLTIGRPL